MILVLLAAALAAAGSLMSAPALIEEPPMITAADFPERMLHDGQSAFENIRLVVGPSGKVEACEVVGEVHSGPGARDDRDIGRLTCALAVRRGALRPAVGADGLPAYGTYGLWIAWRQGPLSGEKQPNQVDGDIAVAALPAGMPDPALVTVDVAVAADGTPGACQAGTKAQYAPASEVNSPALAAVACAQFVGSGKLAPARTGAGGAVASVQRLVARFSAGKADRAAH